MVGFGSIARKFFGSANDRRIKKYHPRVNAINALESEIEALDDAGLMAKTQELKSRIQNGESLDSVLEEAFATVREASKRSLGMRHFDVQLIGGMILHENAISEMRTGEGKTLTSTLPVYLNALTGRGVHVVTVNDYLASRDAEWMSAVYKQLGLTVGVVIHGMDDVERKAAYACDITYATNNELGFDYLRDNMKFDLESMTQRGHYYAIVDEVDSILIDEARTPLIISGPLEDKSELYILCDKFIPMLSDEDFETDEKARTATFTEAGNEKLEKLLREADLLKGEDLYDVENVTIVHHVTNALRAHKLFARDKDYIVKGTEVIIIDEFTGRMMPGRRFSDGLHQALEAKEGAEIQPENQTLASVTFQNYFRMYEKLGGMTGTALTEAAEFGDIYGLEVVDVPTNLPVKRVDESDEVYRSVEEKYRAIVIDIIESYLRGQPVLVGTTSIDKSELISERLKDPAFLKEMCALTQKRLDEINAKKQPEAYAEAQEQVAEFTKKVEELAKQGGIPHKVLNARYHEQEAMIVAQAGVPGAVTIATNMAGRGTDIKLGGNVEMRVEHELADMEDGAEKQAKIAAIEEEVTNLKQKALKAGGLYVLATERHESRRIDNQLRGRSGRQGDPGLSKFFLSLQDDLMRIFGGDRMESMLSKMGLEENEAIIHPLVNKALEQAQKKVEARNFDIRKNVLKYDDVMNDQRTVMFEQRREMMADDDLADAVTDMRHDVIDDLVSKHMPEKAYAEQWDITGLKEGVITYLNMDAPVEKWAEEEGIANEEVVERLTKAADEAAASKAVRIGTDTMRQVEKAVILQTLDHLWREHLLTLEHLRQAVGLRGYAQRDPLQEYKQEAFQLFEVMLGTMRQTVTQQLMLVELAEQPPQALTDDDLPEMFTQASSLDENDDGYTAEGEEKVLLNPDGTKVGRNQACPCGSGKKFKHCHGKLT